MPTGVKLSNDVELSVNVCARDVDFFEPTYRHIVRELGHSFTTRRLIVDRSVPLGRFAASHLDQRKLDESLQALLADGLVDVVEDVDWGQDITQRVMAKYFGTTSAPTRCAAGSPIYQYLFAIEQAASPYLLHLDNDILVHMRDGGQWIDDAIELMKADERVVFTTPEGGPPQAEGLAGWVLGRAPTIERHWQRAPSMSTRTFLVDVSRFQNVVLPLVPSEEGETLERTISASIRAHGLERQSLVDEHNWVIHPRRHNRNHVKHLRSLIRLVETGKSPFRRTGYRWDIRTEGRHFLPWMMAIQSQRLLDQMRSKLRTGQPI